eukprot:scaffold5491_cov117-Isochrysis_galbana.AAC.8
MSVLHIQLARITLDSQRRGRLRRERTADPLSLPSPSANRSQIRATELTATLPCALTAAATALITVYDSSPSASAKTQYPPYASSRCALVWRLIKNSVLPQSGTSLARGRMRCDELTGWKSQHGPRHASTLSGRMCTTDLMRA